MAQVLVTEDDVSIRRRLCEVLKLDHHQLIEAADGRQTLALLREHRPDIAMLDVTMPGLSGLSVCRAIRTDPQLDGLRVTILSAVDTREDARAAGADVFVSKPFRPIALPDLITRLASPQQVPQSKPRQSLGALPHFG